jgi:hypothetical protein
VPEKKVKVPTPTGMADAVEVGVSSSDEKWTDIKLEDGSSLRLKSVIIGALRVEGQWDPEGNPLYMIKANQVMTVSAPEHLRKGGGGPPKGVQ